MKAYYDYVSRPCYLPSATLRRLRKDWVQVNDIVIHRSSVFDLVTPAAYGLLDDLIPGSELCDKFLEIFPKLPIAQDILENVEAENDQVFWFYYPRKRHLV